MKKKVFATLLAVSMIASMVPAAVSVQAADGDSIRLVNGKIEVDAQLKKLAEMYEKETGTKVEIESMGGGIDIQGTLKGYCSIRESFTERKIIHTYHFYRRFIHNGWHFFKQIADAAFTNCNIFTF